MSGPYVLVYRHYTRVEGVRMLVTVRRSPKTERLDVAERGRLALERERQRDADEDIAIERWSDLRHDALPLLRPERLPDDWT